ncbi:MAG: 50S ribosomal protein L35 [Phycisphaerae bacterium]|nr:50S ribosomal protein L35 [Phycisphaerae bacterium]
MPKMKTHKGLKKRIKITANGKVKHKRPNASHLMSGKSGDRGRRLRKDAVLSNVISKNIKIQMGKA